MNEVWALVAVDFALCIVIVWQSWLHQRERSMWVTERRQLVDRAIARHAGEILAFDRHDRSRPKPDVDESRLIEGLS